MIPHTENQALEALIAYIEETLRSTCSGAWTGDESVRQIAGGVAEFCLEQFSSLRIPSAYLALLTARALWAVGEEEASRLFVMAHCPPDIRKICVPFSRRPDEMNRCWKLCAAKILRSSRWVSRSDGLMWTLDMRRIEWSSGQGLELAMRQGLAELIQPIAPVWDSFSGRGELGLLGLREQIGRLINRPPQSKTVQPVAAEMRGLCEDLLMRIGKSRGWQGCPEIVELSL
ncbi:MAG TPA: hypothetical protein PLT67_08085 [Kiritimatiellia bacterium]|nr:hypothetical protein [Kiritimatiellia bacterium]